MKKILFSVLALLLFINTNAQTIEKLRCEYEEKPLGLDVINPRLSWQIKSVTRGTKQTAYQILVADSEANIKKDNGNLWNSGVVKSDQSLWVNYNGKPLESRKRYFWKVKIWNEKNKPTVYSDISWWEMGLLQKTDWSAHWIGKNGTEGKPPKSVELQKEFNLAKRAVRARIYVTGLGAYHLIFNGKKVGQDILTPGWTNYLKTIHYQTYEIAPDDLSIGVNFITATLGNAWWSGGMGWGGGKFAYSDGPCRLLFQMELEFYDGSRQTVISDGSWKTRLSPIVSNSIYNGEVYDARLEYGKDWQNAAIMDDIENKTTLFSTNEKDQLNNKNEESEIFSTKSTILKSSLVPQIQVQQEIKAIKITEPRKGHFVFDFGQNLVGFTHLKVEGKAGKEIEMKFAELLTEKGLVDQANLRSIRPTDKYILKGYGVEEWEPKFTYHGFRYVEVEGLPKKPDENTLVAKVIYSSVPFTGNFACSEDILNKIYKNITWGQRSNMHSVPTDCPQRD
jgi:alpha-L-rhamnosidase